jgi:hypothetical protein
MEIVKKRLVKFFEIRVLLFPIRVYLCESAVKLSWFRDTLDFTRFPIIAKMPQQQLTEIK